MCGVWCVCSAAVAVPFAPAVFYSKREPNSKEYWEKENKKKKKKNKKKNNKLKRKKK